MDFEIEHWTAEAEDDNVGISISYETENTVLINNAITVCIDLIQCSLKCLPRGFQIWFSSANSNAHTSPTSLNTSHYSYGGFDKVKSYSKKLITHILDSFQPINYIHATLFETL